MHVHTCSPTQFYCFMGLGCRNSHGRLSAKWNAKVNIDVKYLLQSPSTLFWQHVRSEIMKTQDMCLLLLSAVLLINGWDGFLDSRTAVRSKSPKSRVEKHKPNQNKSSANIQKHSGVERDSSHRRRLLVSGAGSTQFRRLTGPQREGL